MTRNRQPLPALPLQSSIPSSQYRLIVTTSQRCNCERRWECDECREYWIRRRQRSNERWLADAIGSDGETWFGMFTIKTNGDWQAEVNELFSRWSRLGKLRSQLRYRANQNGLGAIRRGIGVIHLVGSNGHYQPHLHAVLVSDPSLDIRPITNAWQSVGGYADMQSARSLGAVVRYSIAGPLPDAVEDRKEVATLLRGVRIVRRLGR